LYHTRRFPIGVHTYIATTILFGLSALPPHYRNTADLTHTHTHTHTKTRNALFLGWAPPSALITLGFNRRSYLGGNYCFCFGFHATKIPLLCWCFSWFYGSYRTSTGTDTRCKNNLDNAIFHFWTPAFVAPLRTFGCCVWLPSSTNIHTASHVRVG
jgi:hypothetical protein